MKLYIAGPVSGLPDNNAKAFKTAALALSSKGYDTVNPLDLTHDSMSWEECMRSSIKAMLDCEGVALLDGWQLSRGTYLEMNLAHSLGMPCKVLDKWTGDEL